MTTDETTQNLEATYVEPGLDDAPPHATAEMAGLIAKVGTLMLGNNLRQLILIRRDVRGRLFRIRNAIMQNRIPSAEDDSGLRAWMELQFGNNHKWYSLKNGDVVGGFTFEWDVSYKEPLKLIAPFEWDGEIDQDLLDKGGIRKCVPPAFTQQG